ncbi:MULTISPECIES: PhnD/SsuA/transferrin family substrate-binding protein [unclassified Aliihoeflea]|uniref:substrate-binding domain-containing protein n=1 Tax=unclassified Aliihoeflea TaxID=2628764 RepID=UPI0004664884|nr:MULTISPECIES: PhnD/SsuA/transferrin family substrate-binding protein [unclassified Aliihoeflea]MCO6388898.1 PhnD/SsuA/transferrin family substrate-binding protein [Aliihoeflea sp. 40Bstr573]
MKRREFLQMTSAAALFPRTAHAGSTPFRFGLTPVFLSNDLEVTERLRSYFAARLGTDVELVTRRTYQEITALVVSGQIDAAWICGYPYVQYREELELLAAPVWRGRSLYQSYLIVPAGRPVDDWTDLRGDVHAFSDPDSNSGYLVTQALLAESGLREQDFFPRTIFTYGHRNVIRAVAAGLCTSGSVDGYVWEVMRATEPALVDQTQVLRKSEWLAFPPLATSRGLQDDKRVRDFRDVLLAMADDPEAASILSQLQLDGFAHCDPAEFDAIATKFATYRRFG